ncbi:MAG: thioesterase II family protein [Thainema sp.]
MISAYSTNQATNWIRSEQLNPDAALRLFCLPYAGGNARSFRHWSAALPDDVDVCAIELPGHGTRLTEPPISDLDELVTAIAHVIQPFLDRPFALFGHSMGALLSFELARHYRRHNQPMPTHLFVSGHRAPQLPDPEPPIYALPESEFRDKLRRLQGTPQAVLDNDEFMALLLPVLRADFTVCETYSYRPEPPLSCPITAFGGTQDAATRRGRLRAWRYQTDARFTKHVLPGHHFFIHSAETELLQHVRTGLDLATIR